MPTWEFMMKIRVQYAPGGAIEQCLYWKLKKINSKLLEQSSSGTKKSDEPIEGSLKVAGNKGLPKAKKRKLGNESSNIKIPSTTKSTSNTSGIKRAKILKNISNSVVEKTETVRSILNDVDSLLKSADNQNLLDSNISRQDAIDESEDVMKQLEDIINSWNPKFLCK